MPQKMRFNRLQKYSFRLKAYDLKPPGFYSFPELPHLSIAVGLSEKSAAPVSGPFNYQISFLR
jgi:hypothetical protein